MDKKGAVEYLRGMGHDAELTGGVIVVWAPKPLNFRKKAKIRDLLQSVSYKGSWGWRVKQNDDTERSV